MKELGMSERRNKWKVLCVNGMKEKLRTSEIRNKCEELCVNERIACD